MIVTMSLLVLIILTWKVKDVQFFIIIIFLTYFLSYLIDYFNE